MAYCFRIIVAVKGLVSACVIAVISIVEYFLRFTIGLRASAQ